MKGEKRGMYLSFKERIDALNLIEEKTGYRIQSNRMLSQMFRRSSMANEYGALSNEIFEFIGDQILSYYVVKLVSEKCGAMTVVDDYSFRIHQNRFTKIKQTLLNNQALAEIVDEWDIAKYLMMSKSDIKNEVMKEPKVKADLFEAIIGGIAIEVKWNSEILESVVKKALDLESKLNSLIESDFMVRNIDLDNAVSKLKEMAEAGSVSMPKYDFTGPETLGHDKDGNPRWICQCMILDDELETGIWKQVETTSKKMAKKAAAYLVLCEELSMHNKYGENSGARCWIYKDGQLNVDQNLFKSK